MNSDLVLIDVADLAFDIAERSDLNAWFGVVVADAQQHEVVHRLTETLGSIAEIPVRSFCAPEAKDLVKEVAQEQEVVILVWDLEALLPTDWQWLDEARSRLAHRSAVVLILTKNAAERLILHAPNLANWVGSIYRVKLDASSASRDEVQARIAALSAHYGFSSADLIERATRHDLPADPEMAEWLVLLGRGDLLER